MAKFSAAVGCGLGAAAAVAGSLAFAAAEINGGTLDRSIAGVNLSLTAANDWIALATAAGGAFAFGLFHAARPE